MSNPETGGEDARVWAEPKPGFEPTPYFFGISDDPRATWAAACESRGPGFPGLHDLYRAQEQVIATFSSAERQAEAEPEAGP